MNLFETWLGRFPLRARLTLFYLAALGAMLTLFVLYLSLRLDVAILDQVDAGLKGAAVQAFPVVDDEGDVLRFQTGEEPSATMDRLGGAGFAVRLVTSDGRLLDGFGGYRDVPLANPIAGITTLAASGADWRIYSQEIAAHQGIAGGYLQVAQSLTLAEAASDSLVRQAQIALPFMLLLAGVGGWFIAGRALQPIDKVTRTAQTIRGGELSQRIGHAGPDDEVGRLARTFDEMLDRLQTAFERERRFTADASHELRTPLTAIKGQIEVTLSRARSTADYEAALRRLEPQVDRLIRLTSNLLFIARMGLDLPASKPTRVELGGLLKTVIERMHPMADQRKQSLVAELAADLAVSGNADQLIRLFTNLLENAVKFTPPNGCITVRAGRMGGEVVASVTDTGPGIPAADLPHLFERFYRTETDRSHKTGGAGLGLSIASEIVHAHGGVLEAQSTLGAGTTFSIRLPAR